MPAVIGTDPTLGTAKSVGRYFALVSTLPSVGLAVWVYALLASGAWNSAPTLANLRTLSPTEHPALAIGALAGALVLAVASHPAQFTLVQLFEGYWGTSHVAGAIRDRLVFRHIRTLNSAEHFRERSDELLADLPEVDDEDEYVNAEVTANDPDLAKRAITWQRLEDTAQLIEARYPDRHLQTMPTRLGNVLRHHELIAGRAVGLPVLAWATHVGMVAAPEHGAYVADQRTQLDLAVRTSATAGLAAAITFALLWDDGAAVLLTLAPYMVMMLAYRGAVTAAGTYGMALRAWVDLNRFRLYQALSLRQVRTAHEERLQNIRLDDLLRGTNDFNVSLEPTPPPPPPPGHSHGGNA